MRCWQALWIDGDTHTALGCLHDPYVRHGVDGPATMSPEAYVAHVTTITSDLRHLARCRPPARGRRHAVRPLHDARVNVTTGGTIAIAWIGHYRLVDGKLAESWTMRQSDFAW